MRDKLLNELLMLMSSQGLCDESINAKLVLILNNYEIVERETEIVLYDNLNYNYHIIDEFLVSKTVEGCLPKTLNQYRMQLRKMFAIIDKPINTISSDDLKLYIATRQIRDNVSSKTVSNEWHILSSFFSWMTAEEKIVRNPMLKLTAPKIRKQKKKAFTQMECEMIRNSCESLREKALVEVMLSTWCRVSELVGMNISDINGKKIIVTGKGDKQRTVYLNDKAILAINNYLESRTDRNDALFVGCKGDYKRLTKEGIEIIVGKIGKRARVDNVHPHRFRRTGATFALRSGMRIETVSYLLGHESIKTTQIYLDMDENEAEMAHIKYVA